MLLPFAANAQWAEYKTEADELKGEEASTSYFYTAEDGGMFVYFDNKDSFTVMCDKGIFDYSDNYVKAIIGFYDGDKLVEKVEVKLYVPDGSGNMALSSDYKKPKVGPKVIDYINNVGDVRFIIPRYGRASYDIRVPKRDPNTTEKAN